MDDAAHGEALYAHLQVGGGLAEHALWADDVVAGGDRRGPVAGREAVQRRAPDQVVAVGATEKGIAIE